MKSQTPGTHWSSRRVAVAAAGSLLTLAALVAMWPIAGGWCTAFGARVLNVTMSDPGRNVTARFEPGEEQGHLIAVVRLESQRRPFQATAEFKLILSFYLQFATLLALTAWTPVPWRRRWGAALLGLAALVVIQHFTVWLSLMRPLMDHPASRLNFSPAEQGFVRSVWAVVVLAARPATWMSIPVLLWILLTFRRGDFQKMLTPIAKPEGGRTAGPSCDP